MLRRAKDMKVADPIQRAPFSKSFELKISTHGHLEKAW